MTENAFSSFKTVPAADFEQRDYSGVKAEMDRQLAQEMEAFRKGAC